MDGSCSTKSNATSLSALTASSITSSRQQASTFSESERDPEDAYSPGQESDKDTNEPRESRGWRRIIQSFSPAWFLINMGTGIVSILLFNIPYPYVTEPSGSRTHPMWLVWLSTAAFLLNAALFAVIFVVGVLEYTLYPRMWTLLLEDPVQSLFLGPFPIGFSTLGTSFSLICVEQLGWGGPSGWAEMLGWALWWVDVVLSMAVAIGVVYLIITSHQLSLPQQTATMLLPVIAPIVCSGQGAVVANSLSNPDHALTTIMVSLVLWGIGIPASMLILSLFFHRLVLHKLPSKEVIVSMFIPLGPIGQGGFAIQLLGLVAKDVFPKLNVLDPLAGRVFYALGFLIACVLWAFGLLWFFFAAVTVLRNRFPFNMSWWGFTFPLGVYAMSTIYMGKDMPSVAFDVLGTIFSLAVILLWIMVSVLTFKRAFRGQAFSSRLGRKNDDQGFTDECFETTPDSHSDSVNARDKGGSAERAGAGSS